nr:hypothetical protein [Brevibacterium pigmentatum]
MPSVFPGGGFAVCGAQIESDDFRPVLTRCLDERCHQPLPHASPLRFRSDRDLFDVDVKSEGGPGVPSPVREPRDLVAVTSDGRRGLPGLGSSSQALDEFADLPGRGCGDPAECRSPIDKAAEQRCHLSDIVLGQSRGGEEINSGCGPPR